MIVSDKLGHSVNDPVDGGNLHDPIQSPDVPMSLKIWLQSQ